MTEELKIRQYKFDTPRLLYDNQLSTNLFDHSTNLLDLHNLIQSLPSYPEVS